MTAQTQLHIGALVFALVSIAFAVSVLRLSLETESEKLEWEAATSERATVRR
jgi:hypothetical protein